MKKLFSALLLGALVLGFTGCGEPYSEKEIIQLFEQDEQQKLAEIYQDAIKNNYKKTVKVIETNEAKYKEIRRAKRDVYIAQNSVARYKESLQESQKKIKEYAKRPDAKDWMMREYNKEITFYQRTLEEKEKELQKAEAKLAAVKKKYNLK